MFKTLSIPPERILLSVEERERREEWIDAEVGEGAEERIDGEAGERERGEEGGEKKGSREEERIRTIYL